MKKLISLLFILSFSFSLLSQVPNWSWAKTTNCGLYENEISNICLDSNKNIYILGFCDSCNFGNLVINPSGSHILFC